MGLTRFKGDILIKPAGDDVEELISTAICVKYVDGITKAVYGATGVKVFELPPYSAMIDIILYSTVAWSTGVIYAGWSASGTDYLNNVSITTGNQRLSNSGSTGTIASWMNSGSAKRDVYLRVDEAGSAGVGRVAFLFAPGINTPDRAQEA